MKPKVQIEKRRETKNKNRYAETKRSGQESVESVLREKKGYIRIISLPHYLRSIYKQHSSLVGNNEFILALIIMLNGTHWQAWVAVNYISYL